MAPARGAQHLADPAGSNVSNCSMVTSMLSAGRGSQGEAGSAAAEQPHLSTKERNS